MTKIVYGKEISKRILSELKQEIESSGLSPKLDIIMVGSDPSSKVYVNLKKKVGEEIGASVDIHVFENIEKKELIEEIHDISKNSNGIIVQMPIPKTNLKLEEGEDYWDAIREILWEIDPFKDADGLSTKTLGMVFQNFETGVLPATPLAVIEILKEIF